MISPNEAAAALRTYVREPAGPARPAGPGQAGSVQAGGGPQGPGTDATAVQLSPGATQMKQWLAQLRTLPDVRTNRVAEVGSRLQSGQYPPPSRDVAGKILSRWLVDA